MSAPVSPHSQATPLASVASGSPSRFRWDIWKHGKLVARELVFFISINVIALLLLAGILSPLIEVLSSGGIVGSIPGRATALVISFVGYGFIVYKRGEADRRKRLLTQWGLWVVAGIILAAQRSILMGGIIVVVLPCLLMIGAVIGDRFATPARSAPTKKRGLIRTFVVSVALPLFLGVGFAIGSQMAGYSGNCTTNIHRMRILSWSAFPAETRNDPSSGSSSTSRLEASVSNERFSGFQSFIYSVRLYYGSPGECDACFRRGTRSGARTGAASGSAGTDNSKQPRVLLIAFPQSNNAAGIVSRVSLSGQIMAEMAWRP